MVTPRQPAYTVNEPLKRRISHFRRVTSNTPSDVFAVGDFLEDIKTGKWEKQVNEIRATLAANGKGAANDLKRDLLPAVTFSGQFVRRNLDGLREHSGLLCLDFDNLGNGLTAAKESLVADGHVLAVFVSPSGCGLKALVAVEATDSESHGRAFQVAETYFQSRGLIADSTGKDVCRLCFASCDSEVWIRRGAVTRFVLSALLCTTAHSAPSASSAPSARHGGVVECRRARKGIEKSYVNTPRLWRIFCQYVADRPAIGGHRNATITKLIPALYSVVSPSIALRFSMDWYRLNQGLFRDSAEQHEREARALIDGCARSYSAKLAGETKALYAELDEREQILFRICRDLANRSETKDQRFFLSCDEASERIECDSRQAHRILCGFAADGVLKSVTPGQRRAPGVHARASEWKWLLD